MERPSRSEVAAWSPQQLAEYLRRCNLTGCDKVVLKSSISGSRFVNLTDNDLQKFPKLHTPMISKISNEISKKEDKKGIFPKRWTPKNREPETTVDDQGWDDEEFDDADDDYESPYSDNDEGSGGDYESPNDDLDTANDYEPPPSEPQDDPAHKLFPTLPSGDYVDKMNNHVSTRGPPVVCPRPPISTPMPGDSCSRRDASPLSAGRTPGNLPPAPPQIFRQNKPGRESGSSSSPVRGRSTLDKQGAQSWRPDVSDPTTRPKPPILPPPFSTSVTRSNSSARPSPSRTEGRREQTQDEGHKHNTFPFLPPRPGIPGPPSRHADSLPPSVPSSGSLPHNLQSAMAEHRSSVSGLDRAPFRPPPPASTCTQELDPLWYVGKVTRGQAEGCLKQVRKDGAYLVRDSTRQQPNQPFTLMVFYQDKVYNIQIRQQNQLFQLGTGLKVQESFPSVGDIIRHYSQSPLLLIDAKNRSASQQNQCLLSNPAGYHMTR
ncbi:lymphocyte cytosolic protein 2a [Odontesthes bonariensis]|uniref:lymphocyte cytosolic protein 2a n=1 Tax=Odontesthes bonariensis TaxID=219752 RepID=UPI003F58CAC4